MSNNPITLNPYLTFNGNCREAMTFYKEALDGTLEMQTFESAPMEIPKEQKNRIMHATLKFGGAIIMASDSMPGQDVAVGSAVQLSISTADVKNGEQMFKNLAQGGRITMPFEKTFWGAMFGMLVDKFGLPWMVNCELKEQ